MEQSAPPTGLLGGSPFLGPWAKGGTWTLWGPARSETLPSTEVDLMVFRMTGELPLEASPIDGFPHTNAYLIRTASQWVFGVRNL